MVAALHQQHHSKGLTSDMRAIVNSKPELVQHDDKEWSRAVPPRLGGIRAGEITNSYNRNAILKIFVSVCLSVFKSVIIMYKNLLSVKCKTVFGLKLNLS